MRLLLTSFLSIGVTVKAQLRGGGIPASPPRLVASSVNHQHENHRDLMEGMMSGFMPLACNENMQPCVNWSTQAFDPTSGVVTIPCGQCVTMDSDSSADLVLPNGLDIQGKLVFPDGYKITIRSSFIFVQGILEMISTRATSSEQDVKIILTGDDIQTLIPHQDNAQHCPESGCNVGNRPIAIAGGTLDIHGLQETCPTWKKLKNVIVEGVPEDANVPTYTPPPTSPSSTCSDVVIETDFENGQGVSYPSQWYKNYGGTESFESDDGGVSYYTRWSGRTSTWNGPQTNFDPYCIVPGVEYFVKARAKLIGITGYTCLKLNTYMYDQGNSPEKRWSRFGQACTSEDDTWFDFVSGVKVFDELTANPLNQGAFSRRLYWEGPPAGVDIVLDDIKIFRLPSSAYPDTSSGNVCHELLLNGDAEDTSLHPLTYPFRAGPGSASTVQIGSEQNLVGGTNHYFAVRNRSYGYDTPRPRPLWVDCVQKDAMYSISLDLRVHSQSPKTFRVQLTVTQASGTKSWPWLLVCPPAAIDDSWVHCSGNYQFKEADSTATRIDWYLVSDDDSTSDVDFDNFRMSFESGPVSALIVEDDTGDLESCWGASSEILLTPSGLSFDDVKVVAITGITGADGITTLQLAEPIGSSSFSDNEPDFAVEVALLSRNIQFESDSLDTAKGGHLIVLHTPHVAQTLQGVALRKFGQAGNLGRYPVHFHMCGSVHGSLVAKNIVRESNQRCYVIHGSHNVTLSENVAFETHGHCFLLEDSGEMDNTFINNLASVTRKAITLIREEETDNFPSSFWITNPINTFRNNVAAGSEQAGFWFEMKSSVRAPTNGMSHELGQMNPMYLPLTQFEGNIAHSNHEHGFKTYPGTGYEPDGSPAVFKDLKSYRNRNSGVFIHNSRNIAIAGGVFADNRIGIDVDRSPTCSVTNATIIGLSPEYRSLSTQASLRKHCPSSWPIRGLELHTFWTGGELSTGTRVEDTSFANFGNSGCDGSTALRIDPENKGYFDVRTSLAGLSFDAGSEPLSSCDAIHAADQKMGPIDNVAIQDLDGSIMGAPGYIVTNNSRMTAFAPGCTSHPASCTAHCPGLCLRTIGLAVSTFEDDAVELEITDVDSGVMTSFTGEYDWPLNDDGSVNIAEHTKTWRKRLFFATLPSGGNYEARFIKDGQTHWPLFVKTQYEDPDHICPEFASFTVVEPDVEPGYCDDIIRNGDVSAGIENWWATTGGVVTVDESASGQGLAITSEYRSAEWMGPSQFFDTRCLVEGDRYRVSTKVKLIHKDTGAPLNCDSTGGGCPAFTMKISDGVWEDVNEHWSGIGGRDNYWDASLEWNTFEYTLTITEEMAKAGSALLYSECSNLEALIVLDDVSVQKIV